MISYKLFLFFLFFVSISHAQFSQVEIKEIASVLPKGVVLSYDDVEGIIWVSSRGVNLNGGTPMYDDRRTFVKLYFGITKLDTIVSVMPLRIVNRTYKEGWVFFNKITYLVGNKEDVKNGTTKKFTLIDKKTERKTYVAAYVIEKSDVLVDSEIMDFINYVIESGKDVKVRFEGNEKYYEEKTKGVNFVLDFQGLIKANQLFNEKYK